MDPGRSSTALLPHACSVCGFCARGGELPKSKQCEAGGVVVGGGRVCSPHHPRWWPERACGWHWDWRLLSITLPASATTAHSIARQLAPHPWCPLGYQRRRRLPTPRMLRPAGRFLARGVAPRPPPTPCSFLVAALLVGCLLPGARCGRGEAPCHAAGRTARGPPCGSGSVARWGGRERGKR